MRAARVPLRHSLVTRLLVTSVLIAIAATVATAWLAARTATRAITQEQGRSLTAEKGVYDLLTGYAATHADWSGAGGLIHARAAELGRRITLMTPDRTVIADSGGGSSLRTARPSALVDPLALDLGLVGGDERIDARAAGPFRVPAAERPLLQKAAADALICVRGTGIGATVEQLPSGRPAITLATPDPAAAGCVSRLRDLTTRSEAKALRTLGRSTARCLKVPVNYTVYVAPDFSAVLGKSGINGGPQDQIVPSESLFQSTRTKDVARIRTCLDNSRRAMLRKYVAPPALLFVTDPGTGADRTRFTLSPANTARIVATTGAVLLVTIVVTVLVGRRLVRPLRALTVAADRHTPAAVSRQDEIGLLARALHDSAERRDRAETQRRAMVSDVAHELRTPLTNIRSWLEAAQDDLAPTDAQLLTLLHEEAVQLQHIIDDLSDLAAADAGTLRVHPAPTVVRDLLAQVAEAHRAAADTAGVRLETATDGDPVLSADPVRLRQVLGNLVSNAIRYTPPGGSVTVRAHGSTITVRDTGVGISPENLPKIFDRFWRADTSRSRATGGSGLGLPIARKLAEAHGGTLTADSTPGAGTTFTVRLPGHENSAL